MTAPELSRAELLRYARHIALPEVGFAGQQRLKAARVLCVGAGGLGSPLALYLSAAGVGTLGIVDYDTVDESNLQRQILHGTRDIGRTKLESAEARLHDVNPHVRIVRHDTRLTSENALEIVAGYDVVVDGTDNFPTRYLVNDACVVMGKPNVYGSVFRWEGQVSVFATESGPCYRCLFREPPPPGLVPNCAEGGVLGVLPGVIGSLQATETIKLLLGVGRGLAGRLLIFDALEMSWREVALRRNPDCPVCGDVPTQTELIDYERFCGVDADGAVVQDGEDSVDEAEAATVAEWMASDSPPFLLDVREGWEWAVSSLASSGARLIPLGELDARLGEVPRGRPVVVYCRSGQRSRTAARRLAEAGVRAGHEPAGRHPRVGRIGRPGAPGRLSGVPIPGTDEVRPKVVVVGAGFGGIWTARTLVGKPVDVTLVDRNNYHTFFPLLYQVAAAELVPTDIAHPVRSVFRKAENVDVHMADVTAIDLEGRRVVTRDGALPYDVLVVALGSVPDYFGVEGAAQHSFPLRWMDDAIPLRHHVLGRFEAAVHTLNREARRRMLTFSVVGGGPTGVEYAGALAELIHGPLLKDYPRVSRHDVSIQLLEATDRLLGAMPEHLSRYAEQRLAKRRVTVRTGVRVQQVGPTSLELSDGEVVPTETVVWTAGIQGDPKVREWGFPVGPGGRVPVSDRLSLAERPEVYVVGDLAYRTDAEGRALPQVAQVAIQQGRRAGLNIAAIAEGNEPAPFIYRDPGMLAVIGRNSAVAHVFGRAFKGFTAWVLWLVIHIAWLVGFRNRALVFVNWAWNYLFFNQAVRLILAASMGSTPERVAADVRAVRDSGSRSDASGPKSSEGNRKD